MWELIQNDRSTGYRVSLNGWYVDAQDFHDTVEPLTSRFDVQFATGLDIEVAREYVQKLRRVIGLWHENPALHLPHETGSTPA